MVENLLLDGSEVLQVSEMQSRTRTQTAKGLAFEMVVSLGVATLYEKRPMTTPQKDQWGFVRVSRLAALVGEWVAQVY